MNLYILLSTNKVRKLLFTWNCSGARERVSEWTMQCISRTASQNHWWYYHVMKYIFHFDECFLAGRTETLLQIVTSRHNFRSLGSCENRHCCSGGHFHAIYWSLRSMYTIFKLSLDALDSQISTRILPFVVQLTHSLTLWSVPVSFAPFYGFPGLS